MANNPYPFFKDTDFLSGVLFALVGVSTLYVSVGYGFGSPSHMGPGFFPGVIGGLLALMGIGLAIRTVSGSYAEQVKIAGIGRLSVIAIAVLAFGFAIPIAGLILSIALLIFIAWLAYPGRKLRELPIIIIALEVITVSIFVYLLGVPIKLGPF